MAGQLINQGKFEQVKGQGVECGQEEGEGREEEEESFHGTLGGGRIKIEGVNILKMRWGRKYV